VHGGVLGDATQVGFEHVVPVQVGHLAVRLDPHLVLGILGQVVQGSDVKLELAAFGELAKAHAEGEEVVTGHAGGHA
jgi:hypothetical protein